MKKSIVIILSLALVTITSCGSRRHTSKAPIDRDVQHIIQCEHVLDSLAEHTSFMDVEAETDAYEVYMTELAWLRANANKPHGKAWRKHFQKYCAAFKDLTTKPDTTTVVLGYETLDGEPYDPNACPVHGCKDRH